MIDPWLFNLSKSLLTKAWAWRIQGESKDKVVGRELLGACVPASHHLKCKRDHHVLLYQPPVRTSSIMLRHFLDETRAIGLVSCHIARSKPFPLYQRSVKSSPPRNASRGARQQLTRRYASTLRRPQTLVLSDAQRNTIYALSTPPGKAGVAVVRISGPDALQVWRDMVLRKGTGKEQSPTPWKMYRCDVRHPRSQELLDSGLAVYFKGT